MRLAGFQPLTLLDYPGKVAATVFTQGCPFRCVYCHNPELLPMRAALGTTLETEDVLAKIAAHRSFLDGVCVTGGEPTVHPDLPDFLARIKDLGVLVKLDTNGLHPRMIATIIERGLADFFAMDLKHVWERYGDVIGPAGRAAVANCQETMAIIRASGVPSEFRTTVYPALHSEAYLLTIAGYLGPGDRYALQEIRYDKTLQADLPRSERVDLEVVARRIRAAQPDLQVEVRR